MPIVDRVIEKYVNAGALTPAQSNQINAMLALPANSIALNALLSNAANPLVPLVDSGARLLKLVTSVRGNVQMLPTRVVDVLVAINSYSFNANGPARDIVLGFAGAAVNFQYIDDPLFIKLLNALAEVTARSAPLRAYLQSVTFEHFREVVRNVHEPYLNSALEVIGRFHGTAHAAQIVQAYLPSWAKVFSYCPPNGTVTAAIRFNPALLTDHVKKHVLYERINGVLTPDAEEPYRWMDFLDYYSRVNKTWVKSFYPHSEHLTLFRDGNVDKPYLVKTLEAKKDFMDLLNGSAAMRNAFRTTKRIESDYEKAAIRTLLHGRKFVHYTDGNVIFITGELNGLYVMARFVDPLPTTSTSGDFYISTAYLPSRQALNTALAQWVPTAVWTLV